MAVGLFSSSGQIANFINNNDLEEESSVEAGINLHLELLMSSEEYFEINAEAALYASWMWPILKEIAIEVILEIVENQLGDIGPVDFAAFIDLAQDVQQNDLLGMISSLLEIGDNIFPGLKSYFGWSRCGSCLHQRHQGLEGGGKNGTAWRGGGYKVFSGN